MAKWTSHKRTLQVAKCKDFCELEFNMHPKKISWSWQKSLPKIIPKIKN
jgi:hypothetical protein